MNLVANELNISQEPRLMANRDPNDPIEPPGGGQIVKIVRNCFQVSIPAKKVVY